MEFASEEIRRLQASDAENPGMLWVDQGAKLFAQKCASCHVSMKGVAARYPAVENGRIVTLEAKVRHKEAFAYESDELLALTAYIANQSRGMPIKVNPPAEKLDIGRKAYYSRRGQMNLACAHCHEQNWGKHLGAETLSQGQPNGYPAYRLEWQKMGSLERRIRACPPQHPRAGAGGGVGAAVAVLAEGAPEVADQHPPRVLPCGPLLVGEGGGPAPGPLGPGGEEAARAGLADVRVPAAHVDEAD